MTNCKKLIDLIIIKNPIWQQKRFRFWPLRSFRSIPEVVDCDIAKSDLTSDQSGHHFDLIIDLWELMTRFHEIWFAEALMAADKHYKVRFEIPSHIADILHFANLFTDFHENLPYRYFKGYLWKWHCQIWHPIQHGYHLT